MNLTVTLDDLWEMKPTQKLAIEAVTKAAPYTVPAYIGALGSGKTWTVCRVNMGMALAHPGLVSLVGRFNYTELRDTTLVDFFAMVNQVEGHVRDRLPANRRHEFPGLGKFSPGTGDYHWFNGSVTMFRHLEDGHRRFKSLRLGAWQIDEASEVEADRDDPPTVQMLYARLRQQGMPNVGFMVSNPTGFDHWLYKWYGEGVEGRIGIGKKGWPVYRTRTSENAINLPPEYERKLREQYSADYVRRYLEGEWGGVDEGAPVFPTIDRTLHVRPVEWMRRHPVHVGIDLGYNAPAVVWAQVDPGPSKRLNILRSWGPFNLDVYKLAQGIKARNDEWFPNGRFQYYCGHDGNARKDTNEKSSAQILGEYGMAPHVRFTAVERGFSTLRSLLAVRDDGVPGLLIAPANPVLIEALAGGYRYDADKEDEPLTNGRHDQYVDALRYIVVNLFTTNGTLPAYTALPAFKGLGV